MIKKTFLISILIIFFSLNNCSLNKNSNFWNEKSNNIDLAKNNKVLDNKNIDISYDMVKKRIIDYSKKKDFPDINN